VSDHEARAALQQAKLHGAERALLIALLRDQAADLTVSWTNPDVPDVDLLVSVDGDPGDGADWVTFEQDKAADDAEDEDYGDTEIVAVRREHVLNLILSLARWLPPEGA
jgi:hypothetical protein